MTATIAKRRGSPRSKLDQFTKRVRVEAGVAVYACRGCSREIQPDNRRGGRHLPGVLRHNRSGFCLRCCNEFVRAGEEVPAPVLEAPPEIATRTGFCACGCGGRTPIAAVTDRSRGHVAGYPCEFVHGHGSRRRPVEPEPVVETEQQWKARAACRAESADPRAFEMPEGPRGGQGPTPEAQLAARRWCAQCPVIAECGDLAEQLNESAAWPVVGLWGGEWRSHAGITPIRTATPIRTPEPAPAGSAA